MSKKIELLYGEKLSPNYYIINNTTKGQNYAYHDKEEYLNWVYFDRDKNIEHGELHDLKNYKLVDEFDVDRKGNCRALAQRK